MIDIIYDWNSETVELSRNYLYNFSITGIFQNMIDNPSNFTNSKILLKSVTNFNPSSVINSYIVGDNVSTSSAINNSEIIVKNITLLGDVAYSSIQVQDENNIELPAINNRIIHNKNYQENYSTDAEKQYKWKV